MYTAVETAYTETVDRLRAAAVPLTRALAEVFGDGRPGWFERDVPGGTTFDFERGIVTTTFGRFIRSPATGKWAAAS